VTVKISEERITTLLQYLRDYDIRTACQYTGITTPTYYAWKNKGKQDLNDGVNTIESRFYVESEKARAVYKGEVISALRGKALEGDVPAGKMILGSSDRKTWGDKIQVEQEIEKFMGKLKERLPDDVYQQVLDIATEE
jgi:hypothetical protein